MNRTPRDQALAALAADALATPFGNGAHPSFDELLAYHDGTLDAAVRDRLQEHLAWCDDCARTVADMASFPDVEPRDPALTRTAAEEAEDWQAIRQKLGLDADTVSPPSPLPFAPAPAVEPPAPAGTAPRTFGGLHLLAAVLALAVVGLSVQVTRLSRPPVDPTPFANVFVVDLEPGDPRVRTADDGVDVPAGMETVVFLLIRDDVRPFDDHAVELVGHGEVFWQAAGLARTPEGSFSVAVPLTVLPSDAIEIRLYGVAGGERERLATYRAHVGRDARP